MNGQETNLMEGDILAEEKLNTPTALPKTPEIPKKPALPKIDTKTIASKIAKLKRPKLISIFLLFFATIIFFTALIVLQGKIPQEQILDPDILITSPRPTPTISPELSKILNDISAYETKAKSLNESHRNYPPPKVDLNVKF